MMWSGYGFGWGSMIGGLAIILFWVGVIALIVFAVRRLSGSKPPAGGAVAAHGSGPALMALEERYARGEITKEEFETIRRDIES